MYYGRNVYMYMYAMKFLYHGLLPYSICWAGQEKKATTFNVCMQYHTALDVVIISFYEPVTFTVYISNKTVSMATNHCQSATPASR